MDFCKEIYKTNLSVTSTKIGKVIIVYSSIFICILLFSFPLKIKVIFSTEFKEFPKERYELFLLTLKENHEFCLKWKERPKNANNCI